VAGIEQCDHSAVCQFLDCCQLQTLGFEEAD
jgi:hypothetical protein